MDRDRHDRRAGLECQPPDPAPDRVRQLAGPRAAALAVHGHAAAPAEHAVGRRERLLVGEPAPHREHAAVGVDPLQRRHEELRLGHEADLAADRGAEEEVVHERRVIGREDHRARRGDLLGADPTRAEEHPRVERGGDPHRLVDPVRVAGAGALVEAREVLCRARILVDLLPDRGEVLLLRHRVHCASSASEQAQKAARAVRPVGNQLAHRGQPRPQLGVADLDRHHRVLQLGEDAVGLLERVRGLLDEPARPLRRQAGRGGRERPSRQPVALGEARVGALDAAVRRLHGPEELLLQTVAARLVELLVRRAQRGDRDADLLGRLGDRAEQLLPRLARDISHGESMVPSFPPRERSGVAGIEAHITGTIWKIEVAVGDTVEEGDTVAILESMKMEMPVEAEDEGTVKEILVAEGQAVSEGDMLIVLE